MLQCASGYYAASTGSTSCTVCPANFKCANPAVAPVACAGGEVNEGCNQREWRGQRVYKNGKMEGIDREKRD